MELSGSESKPTSELIDFALVVEECEEEFPGDHLAILALHERGNREVLDAGIVLCRSSTPSHRRLGAKVLGELGSPDRTFPEECCDMLLDLVRSDPDESVVTGAIIALGHLGNRRCESYLIPLHQSSNAKIRRAIAFALLGTEVPASVEILIKLMDDPEDSVRDWATTSIGETVSVDGLDIRSALLRRAVDTDEMTRAEALHGLARRKDERVLPYLIAALLKNPKRVHLFADAAKSYLGVDELEEMPREELLGLLRSHDTGL